VRVVATDAGESTKRDPRLVEVVSELQRSLDTAGIRSALLHETPGSLEEHDIDIAVDGPWVGVWSATRDALQRLGYQALLTSEYDVGSSWYSVFAKQEGTELRRIAIDICGDVRGIAKFGVPMRALLADTIVRDGIRMPDPSWISTYVIAKHAWKRREASPALEAAFAQVGSSPRDFVAAARRVFGRRLSEDVAARAIAEPSLRTIPNPRALLRAIRVRRGARAPILPLRFVHRWIVRLIHPAGTWIVVAGTDGSGKSSVASRLSDRLAPYFRRRLKLHWSPGVLPRPGSLVGREARDPSRPHGAAPHGRVLSTLASLYHWFDHALGYTLRIRPTLVRSGIVVMERGYHDVLVDPLRYRLNSSWLAQRLGRLLPQPDVTILLLGDPSVLHARKPELAQEEIERQQGRWVRLGGDLGTVAVVDAGRPLEEVLAASLEAVIARASSDADLRSSTRR
jgi:thymidylate kinase